VEGCTEAGGAWSEADVEETLEVKVCFGVGESKSNDWEVAEILFSVPSTPWSSAPAAEGGVGRETLSLARSGMEGPAATEFTSEFATGSKLEAGASSSFEGAPELRVAYGCCMF
jgi:hypothetical protein